MAVFLVSPAYLFVELGLVDWVDVPDVFLLMLTVYLVSSGCIVLLKNRPSTLKQWLLLVASHLFTVAVLALLALFLNPSFRLAVPILPFGFGVDFGRWRPVVCGNVSARDSKVESMGSFVLGVLFRGWADCHQH